MLSPVQGEGDGSRSRAVDEDLGVVFEGNEVQVHVVEGLPHGVGDIEVLADRHRVRARGVDRLPRQHLGRTPDELRQRVLGVDDRQRPPGGQDEVAAVEVDLGVRAGAGDGAARVDGHGGAELGKGRRRRRWPGFHRPMTRVDA